MSELSEDDSDLERAEEVRLKSPAAPGRIIRIDTELPIGRIYRCAALFGPEWGPAIEDVPVLVVAEETREAYLAQGGDTYTAHTIAEAHKPGVRFYRVLMD